MRRKEREITSRSDIDAIMNAAMVCRLALADDEGPYIVPLCFGYSGGTLYFHTAKEGRKLDILRKNNRVCFEMVGRAYVVADEDEKRRALDVIMRHYAGQADLRQPAYIQSKIDAATVLRVEIEEISGKQSS
jgi:nitroimidazol reductase NimA-like FMN-containing flavoprotein (pyridoxamine 5'-phosphate oxidase superfamily)